jgi:copper resistance protein B
VSELALSFAAVALVIAAPALAQNQDAHAGHGDHAGHTMDPPADPSPGPTMELPPPEEAGSGPPRAADAIWGAEAMAPSRAALKREHGSTVASWIQADRLEYQARAGHDGLLWDLQGYYGTPTSKLWLKSEGEAVLGEGVEDAEVQALWSKAVAPYWDLQVGVRQDLAGETDTHAVIGIQGLAPYLFEIDAALFLSQRGDVTARIEAELDQRITQRLILQPRVELSLAAQDNAVRKVGAGIDKIEVGLRLRYEIVPEFAPYVGIEQGWKLGGSARYARLAGEDPSVTSVVMGVRFWF